MALCRWGSFRDYERALLFNPVAAKFVDLFASIPFGAGLEANMGVGVIREGVDEAGNGPLGVLYDTVVNWAFGPVFRSGDEAEAFLAYLGPRDPRTMNDIEIEEAVADFRAGKQAAHD